MSTITIYKTSRITPSRNLRIDDLESYLSTIESETFSDFQYIRPKLDGVIKINKGQEYAFWDTFVYDYLKVVNGNGEKTQYYFITKVEQKSEETLELTLHMDVINTFEGAYEISPNSVIHREFKDRWKKAIYYESKTVKDSDSEYFIDGGSYSLGDIIKARADGMPLFQKYPTARILKAVAHFGTETLEAYACGVVPDYDTDVYAYFDNGHGRYIDAPDYVEYTFDHETSIKAVPIIDYLSEGVEPQLYKEDEIQIPQFNDQSWNLVYRGQATFEASSYNYVSAVDVFLCPDEPTPVKFINKTGRTKTASGFATNKYTFFRESIVGWLQIRITHENDSTETLWLTDNLEFNSSHIPVDGYVYSDGNYITIYRRSYDPLLGYMAYGSKITQIKSIEFLTDKESIAIGVLDNLPSYRPTESVVTQTLTLGSYSYQTCYGLTNTLTSATNEGLDLTDPRLMKVLKLPYPPANGSIDSEGNVSFDAWGDYSESEHMFKGTISATAYEGNMTTTLASPMNPLGTNISVTSNKKLAWSKEYEPKLYHSDFYQPKFVYDSFSFLFELEKVNATEWRKLENKDNLRFDFLVTSTINSRFMFRFKDYVLEKSQSDYDNILAVRRNNEVTIYSNQYMNYLRTGYNYDVKNKERGQFLAGVGIGNSLLGLANPIREWRIGNMESPATEMPSKFGNVFGSIVGNIQSIVRAEEAMEQKKRSLQNQQTAVSGSDDIDLLVAYSNNQAKMVYYKPSEMMTNALATLFHYCGYVSERRGKPIENTRYWFDYCKADIDFINERHAPAWALEEVRSRYAQGITTLHNHSNEWDIEQQYENWEVSLD